MIFRSGRHGYELHDRGSNRPAPLRAECLTDMITPMLRRLIALGLAASLALQSGGLVSGLMCRMPSAGQARMAGMEMATERYAGGATGAAAQMDTGGSATTCLLAPCPVAALPAFAGASAEPPPRPRQKDLGATAVPPDVEVSPEPPPPRG